MKKILLFALSAAVLLASCSKEDKVDTSVEGAEATMRLAITLPQAMGTRVTEATTAAESKIDKVYVYVFNQDGTPASAGAFSPLTITTHFNDKGNGLYEMKDGILTTAGQKIIYVAANLPSGFTTAPANEAALLAEVAVHTQLLNYSGSTLVDLVMFAKTTKKLIATIDGTNSVDVDMERAVARLISTYDNTAFPSGTISKTWVAGSTISFNVRKYFVAQDAYKSYLAPAFYGDGRVKTLISEKNSTNWGTALNLYDPDDHLPTSTIDYRNMTTDPGAGSRANVNGFYIGENATTTANTVARFGNTTFAYIQTVASITATAKMDAAGTAIEETGGPAIVGGSAGNDFYIVRVVGVRDYICNATNYSDVANFLEVTYPANVKIYKYPQGYVYYRVYLNRTETQDGGIHKYNVYRNQFIHIELTGLNVNGMTGGGFGGGYPGEETNPEVPTDPNEVDPNNPNPTDPTDPIDELEATLLVNITVTPWEYVKNATTLE